ncbi:MAG: T9SS type A sorting domain-containing protein, partial [Bacteroidota bacterium]
MRNKITFLLVVFATTFSFGQVLINEDFTYPDSALTTNGTWTAHSGAGANPVQVSSNEIILTHGSGSREDVNLTFTSSATTIYAGFDIVVNNAAPISGSDSEYFAHFNTTGFVARVDIVPPSGAGDFRVGIASSASTAEATSPVDLTFGVTYRVVVRYSVTTGVANLWIDPSLETDASATALGSGTGTAVSSFAFRQSNSSSDETISIDNLIVSESFMDSNTLSTGEITSNNDFILYPNPVEDSKQITIQGINRNTSVTIHNVLGNEVLKTTITN